MGFKKQTRYPSFHGEIVGMMPFKDSSPIIL